MPNISAPCAVWVPPATRGGSWISLPLLSLGKAATGFETCCAVATVMGAHPARGQLKYVLCGPVAQVEPQSCGKTPIPKIPLALSALTLFSALPVVCPVQAAGAAAKLDGAMTSTGIEDAVSPETCTCAS